MAKTFVFPTNGKFEVRTEYKDKMYTVSTHPTKNEAEYISACQPYYNKKNKNWVVRNDRTRGVQNTTLNKVVEAYRALEGTEKISYVEF